MMSERPTRRLSTKAGIELRTNTTSLPSLAVVDSAFAEAAELAVRAVSKRKRRIDTAPVN